MEVWVGDSAEWGVQGKGGKGGAIPTKMKVQGLHRWHGCRGVRNNVTSLDICNQKTHPLPASTTTLTNVEREYATR